MNAHSQNWREAEKLNQQPLNQQAKQALLSVRESPNPGRLYLLQLLQWALEKGKVKLAGPLSRREMLKESLETMNTWSPEKVMEVFYESAEGDPVNLAKPGPVNPVGLAEALLDQLDSRLIAAGMYPDQRGKDYD